MDGSTPALLTTVSCSAAGNYTLAVPAGTTSVDADVVGGGGGAGYPARAHIGGNAAEVTGALTLPSGTAYLYVIVGVAGSGDNHGSGIGGGASAVFAEDSGHGLLAKLVIAGAGGSGSYNGDGGDAGSAGTSENTSLSSAGSPGVGATGGAGGSGNYANGGAGGNDNAGALTVAAGGNGGGVPGGAYGGGGGGGYGGGGGGGGGTSGVLTRNVAAGGGGSSLASAYLGSAGISIKAGTGGIQLPGLVAGDGTVGTVTLTFDGLAVPGSPTDVSATAGDGQVSVSFTAPDSNGGDPITSYTVTSSPGGSTATCPGSPCVLTGLNDGTSYTVTVHATNANGNSPESAASAAVTPATPPDAPTGVSATAGAGQASVSFTAPAGDGGSPVTSYTATSAPGGVTATCQGSPCVVRGLADGTTYTFTVHATNGIGASPESAASGAVTPVSVPNAPKDVTADPGDGQTSISFSAPVEDGGVPIASYTVTSAPGRLTATCPGSPCVVTGLANGTSYTFTVHATNSQGDSAESVASAAVTPAALPGPPTGVSAMAGDGQASVTFTTPASDGGSAINSYTVTAAPGGLTATCPGSPCVVTGLDNGTSYTFTAHATNAIGHSSESAVSSTVTPVGAPDAPAGLIVTPGDGQVRVSFPAPGDGGSTITGYQVSLDGGLTFTTLSTTTTGGTVSGTVTGLTNGTTYSVQVRAINAQGPGDASAAQSVTPATIPDAPTGVTAARGNGSAEISFVTPASDGGAPVISYTVTSTPGGVTATCPGSPCVITGLDNGTTYTFTAQATNAAGDSAESATSNPVTPATAPGTLGAVTVTGGNSLATVTFIAPATSGGSPISGYEYSTDGGATWYTLNTSGTAPVTGSITGLINGTEYPVQVRAVNAVGAGAASGPVSVTPSTTPDAPTGVSAITGPTQASVFFTPPAFDGGAPVISYTVTAAPGGATSTCTASPCLITGLTNGTAYTFTVHATNATGDSPVSAASAPVTPVSAPGAPAVVTGTATDTTATVSFTAPDAGGSPITSYEYSTDGGQTWLTVTTTASGLQLTGTITGLTPGTQYSIVVRGLNAVGDGIASTAVLVSTLPAAVEKPTAQAGVASATVTWAASATSTVAGYTVHANPGPATCTTTARTATSCVIGAITGVSSTYTVTAHSAGADSPASPASDPTVATAPPVPVGAPTTAPTTLTTTNGSLTTAAPGQQITVVGTGFLPYSSVTIIAYSKPEVLGTTVTDAHGDFTRGVTLPTDLTPGHHNLVASGVTTTGANRYTRMPFIIPPTTTTKTGTITTGVGKTGTETAGTTQAGSTATTPTGNGSLAYTGMPALQVTLWAMLTTAAGTLLMTANRRRSRA